MHVFLCRIELAVKIGAYIIHNVRTCLCINGCLLSTHIYIFKRYVCVHIMLPLCEVTLMRLNDAHTMKLLMVDYGDDNNDTHNDDDGERK